MSLFRKKPTLVVSPLPAQQTQALDAAEAYLGQMVRETHERVERTLQRLKQIDPGEAPQK